MKLNESLKALKFDSILAAIAGFSNSGLTRKEILEISPFQTREEIYERFGRIQEIRRLSAEGTPLQLSGFQDISQFIEKIRPEGAVIEAAELLAFIPALRIIRDISVQIIARNDLPLLKELAGHLTGFPGILNKLERSLDNSGKLLDHASPELFRLRSSIRSLEAGISKRLEEIIRHKKITPFLQDSFITKRAERWVIPVRMDAKGQVRGVVHDVSRSGETAYIEPLEIIGVTNEIENLIAEEKMEQIRILRDICNSIRKEAHEIAPQFRTIVCLDVLNSIAEFADLLKMNVPKISDSFYITLKNARHPLLLLLQQQAASHEIVPLDIALGYRDKVIVITGPNAGGKTIAIKTVGLLLLMALSGIPVAADPASSFPLVNEVLIDIGDEQSIENSLSTFSAHISNISRILKSTDSNTIVLIDELGTGTEPVQGAALACSVLKSLKEKGAIVLATTHLTEIVGFVHKTEGMINASMEFDENTVAPLYKLLVGEPGQSHALDIARRYGLPEEVLAAAKELLGGMGLEFQGFIAELKEKRTQYEEAFRDIELRKADIEQNEILLKAAIAGNDRRRREILEEAYCEAKELLAATKRQTNVFLEEARRERKREGIKNIEQAQFKIEEKLAEFQKDTKITLDEIKEGDVVFARSIGYDVAVIGVDMKQKRLRVRAGNMYMELPVSDISLKQGRTPPTTAAYKVEEEEDFVPSSLKLIGLRVDEALSRLEPFLNHASLSGLPEVTVIHGVGTGALLKAVREHLNGHPLVKGFRSGEQFEGGSGVTIIKMR